MARSNLALSATQDLFDEARMKFEDIVTLLNGGSSKDLSANGLESLVDVEGRELLRQLLQAALAKRAQEEPRLKSVTGEDGVERTHVREGTQRPLMTTFGRVEVTRIAYGARSTDARMPLDAALSLPRELYSSLVRRRIAEYAAEMSYEKARRFHDAGGSRIPPRQVGELVERAARDFEAFYASRRVPTTTDSLLVLTFDGKGIAMRKESLREGTRKSAETPPRLDKRRSKGEPAHRKRMAELAAVYDVAPCPRTGADIMNDLQKSAPATSTVTRPRATNKWYRASVERDMLDVVIDGFCEAERRDPTRQRRWVVLVDGNEEQLRHIEYCAEQMGVEVTIVLDVIHVLEYLWKAGLSFFAEGSKELEAWVEERLLRVLDGRARDVAAGIRRSATKRGLSAATRKNADACARYLLKYQRFLAYSAALRDGLPIATGVIEGACRSVVADRMAIAGARWGLKGAEAVLRLRTLRMNGDFEEYWRFHLAEEHRRIHKERYADTPDDGDSSKTSHLQLITSPSF